MIVLDSLERVYESRAVIGKPKVILADEPVGSLHTDHGRMIMELLARLNREGTTVIQVTHSADWAAYGSRVIRLKDGWLDGEERTVRTGSAPAGGA